MPAREQSETPSAESDRSFWILLTAVMSAPARPAAVTRSHADALEQLYNLLQDAPHAGIELVELTIAPQSFNALRTFLQKPAHQVAIYDVFAIPASVSPQVRKISAQYLAADSLLQLEAQGVLGGTPLSLHLNIPKDWDVGLPKIKERLAAQGALALQDSPNAPIHRLREEWHRSLIN